MIDNELFQKFTKERNIKESTQKGYETALKSYLGFHGKTIGFLINEAMDDEENMISLKERNIKKRLIDYRSHLFSSNISPNTARTYLTKIKTFYRHFEIEVPELPNAKYDKTYETNYLDLPTKEHIRQALDLAPLEFKAIILFMSSSGTAKAETLSLTVGQFIDACKDYHGGGSIEQILDSLSKKDNIIPTFYLKRIKTDKFYYTFCSPEASSYIIRYLKTRNDLKLDDSLFNVTSSGMLHKFQEINDILGWGFKGKYRFFRSHSLRKFHASNIGLSAEYVDSLQGRSKSITHEAYIKTNPDKLKEIYASAMDNIIINVKGDDLVEKQEFTIIINVFLSGKEYNIL